MIRTTTRDSGATPTSRTHFTVADFTCDGVLATAALLGHTVLVAVDAEDLVLVVGKAGPCQSL